LPGSFDFTTAIHQLAIKVAVTITSKSNSVIDILRSFKFSGHFLFSIHSIMSICCLKLYLMVHFF